MTAEPRPGVLLVDDDPQLLEIYSKMLEGPYDLYVATSGESALETLSDAIDVVLLDRRMPGMSGDEVVAAIREEGFDCRVAMVTAIGPDVDIVDMEVDDYLVKPVTGSKLRNVVDSLLQWSDYDEVLAEYYELARKVAVLEEENQLTELEGDDDYRRLKERLSTLQAEAEELVDGTEAAFVADIVGGDGSTEGSAETAGSRSG